MRLVSVIIPCYKDYKTLPKAIESVLSQSYYPIEIIVVNDCSPETELIEKCVNKYPNVRYLRNEKNVGLAATRNNGIAFSNGDVVAFLDADDEYHKDKIALQMELLGENTVVTCAVINVLPSGKYVVRSRANRVLVNPHELIFSNKLNGAGLLALKSVILDLGGYDPNLRSCEDFDLWLRILSSGIQVNDIGRALYYYHYNPEGLSKNFRNISHWELEVIKLYASRKSKEWKDSLQYAFILLFWLLKHLFRGELASDKGLWEDTRNNCILLNGFPLIKFFFLLIANLRLLLVPSCFLRLYKWSCVR